MIPVHFGTLPPIYPPQISTRDVTEISAYSATCGGNILSDGGKEILTSGICWSTSSIPTIEDFKTTDGTKRFSFRSTMTNLVPGTKYYVRAYGALYNWPAALTACPSGWHLPSDEEWKQLEGYLGLPIEEFDNIGFRGSEQGIQLKSPAGWTDDVSGTNSSGFTASLPDIDSLHLNGWVQDWPGGLRQRLLKKTPGTGAYPTRQIRLTDMPMEKTADSVFAA